MVNRLLTINIMGKPSIVNGPKLSKVSDIKRNSLSQDQCKPLQNAAAS
jgi:hypothetical protein